MNAQQSAAVFGDIDERQELADQVRVRSERDYLIPIDPMTFEWTAVLVSASLLFAC